MDEYRLEMILEAMLTRDTQRVADELEAYRARKAADERYMQRVDAEDENRIRTQGGRF